MVPVWTAPGLTQEQNGIKYYQDYQSVLLPGASGSSLTPVNFPIEVPIVPAEPVPESPADPQDLVTVVSEVQITGLDPDLQQIVRQTIRTQTGGETSQSLIRRDVAALLNTGLLAQVNVITRPTVQGLSVTYEVTPIVLRSIQITGAEVLPQEVATTAFQSQFGQAIRPGNLNQAAQQINQWYRQQGYPVARVFALQTERSGLITLVVAEGRIEAVGIRFLNREGQAVDGKGQPFQGQTQTDFLRRELQLQPGQILSNDRLQKDIQHLKQLGLFDRVGVALSGEADRVTVTYELVEADPNSFIPGGGVDDVSGIYGSLTYINRNIAGVGQTLALTLQIGQRNIQYNGSFTSPYRRGNPDMPGYRIEGYNRSSLSPIFDDKIRLANGDPVQVNQIGGGITFDRPIGDWQGFLGLNYTRYRLQDGSDRNFASDAQGNPLTLSGTGIDDLSTILIAAQRDQRNDSLNPTDGSFVRFSSEQSLPIGLGTILSNRLQASYSQYFPLRLLTQENLPEVLAYNLQAGTTIGDLPPYRAFPLGGPESVRGYDYGQVGSGRSYVLASVEYRLPLLTLPFLEWPLMGVFFTDFASDLGSGNAVPGQPALTRNKPGSGFGYGTGLRFLSPLGVLRLDFGISDRGDTRINFGFGQRF
ncbi:BamA/TamA family outer membrane protein [Leptolyngbya sp. 'hensonii']|uniref:BamA/TamA family outer membrane protein n=1 Tax=Leptolyngbya sp. 'hensonii' TaxID=1922337 RepID=UPI000AF3DAD9|nr:BamA/TamA family outer membrane protein [Leptolyngbya sp. 'hensonii']